MKILQSALIASAVLLSGQAFANEPAATNSTSDEVTAPAAAQAPAFEQAPVRLTTTELDRVTAGALGLPNEKIIFSGFDNAAPGEMHPSFDRSPTGSDASGNDGPWRAAFNSPVIEFVPF